MRDFDELLEARLSNVEDRQFKLRGETFTLRPSIRPEAMTLFFKIGDTDDDVAGADVLRQFMEEVLQDDDLAKWDELRAVKGEKALTIADMTEVASFALGKVVGRPPTRPQSSGRTSGVREDSTPSTGKSVSPVAG